MTKSIFRLWLLFYSILICGSCLINGACQSSESATRKSSAHFCRPPLRIHELKNTAIPTPEGSQKESWQIHITADNGSISFGYINDNENKFHGGQKLNESRQVEIYIDAEPLTCSDGYSLILNYDGGKTIRVYLPKNASELYYIGADGSTYHDRWLCEPAYLAPPK